METLRAKVVGLVAKNSCDYVVRAFAGLAAGHVVVPLRSADDAVRIGAARVSEIVEPKADYGWLDSRIDLSDARELALVAFTSGTEGQPKGVLLTHANLANATRRIQQAMLIDDSIREYIGVPVYHSFGFGRCRAIAAAGGRAYVPKAGFDLREICSLLEADAINAISAVPSLWRLALSHRALLEPLGHKVKWIEIGSQPMRAEEKRDLRALFPNARMVQHYGLTEASRSTFLDVSSASDEELDSVGEPNGDVEVEITPEGRIKIRGGHVAEEILVDGRRVKNVDADGWLLTGDLGEKRGGKLYFSGRADDVINCGGIKIAPDAIEHDIETALGIAGGIGVARIPDAARGDGVLVALEPHRHRDEAAVQRAAVQALLAHGVNAKSAIRILRVPALPTTESGKLKRTELARIYGEAAPSAPTSRLTTLFGRMGSHKPHTVRAVFEQAFPGVELHETDTFVGLGGDSLSFAAVSIALGQVLGELPNGWQNLAIGDLERARSGTSWLRPVDTALLLRFISIVAIVTNHFTPLSVGGSTFLLLAVAGYNFSRFQLPNVLATGSVRSILLMALRIAVPTVLVIGAIQFRHFDLDVRQLVLLGNWDPSDQHDLRFWFVELLTQLLLILAALLCLTPVQQYARRKPSAFISHLLVVSVAAALFAPLVWNSTHLFDRVPQAALWLLMLGAFVHRATTAPQRVAAVGLVLALPLLIWGRDIPHWVEHGREYIWAGALLLLFVTSVRVPYPLSKLVYWIGDASMFIYITHWSVQSVWHVVTPLENEPLDIVVALAVGVLAWRAWDHGTRRLVAAIRARLGHHTDRAHATLEKTGI